MTAAVSNAHLSSVLDRLTARSRGLGADRTICNWGGGNTSSKTTEPDHTGRPTRIMWVKGSGSDLATVTPASFTGLRLDEVRVLRGRPRVSDTEMVAHLRRCMTDPTGRGRRSRRFFTLSFRPPPSITRTPMPPITLPAPPMGSGWRANFSAMTSSGFPTNGRATGSAAGSPMPSTPNPAGKLVILQKHGSITWGDDDEACTSSTFGMLARAKAFVDARLAGKAAFGGARCKDLTAERRREIAADIMPLLRGAVSTVKPCVLRFEDAPDVLTFVNSVDAPRLAAVGAACPDHLVHTKVRPHVRRLDAGPRRGRPARGHYRRGPGL